MTELSVEGFALLEKVGEGAMSEVYRAHTLHGEEVAVKLMRPFLRSDKTAWERMQREGQILAQLDHERIIKFHQLEHSQDGRLALVQEFVHGDNLNTLLEKTRQRLQEQKLQLKGFPVTAMALVSEVLLGLEEAHRLQIIHRDLKPENLLLTAQGKIKITDFGIAKVLSSKDLTITGTIIGSPAYMSPEQLSERPMTASTDFFSLGVLLYQWSTGEFPFKGESYPGLTQAILNDQPKAPHELNPYIHPELSRIILKALDKDPQTRYQKAYEFRYELMRLWDQLELPSSFQVLTSFYQGNLDYEQGLSQRLVQTLINRALVVSKAPLKSKDNHAQLILSLKQIFKLDPHHQLAKRLYLKAQRKALSRRLVSYGIVLILLLFTTWFGLGSWQPEKSDPIVGAQIPTELQLQERAPAIPVNINPTDGVSLYRSQVFTKSALETSSQVPVKAESPMVSQPVSIKTAAIERPAASETKQRKERLEKSKAENKPMTTRILFNVEENVRVFVDDQEVTKKLGSAFAIDPGSHRIQMVKAGFHPITSMVQVPEGETTIINARPNNE